VDEMAFAKSDASLWNKKHFFFQRIEAEGCDKKPIEKYTQKSSLKKMPVSILIGGNGLVRTLTLRHWPLVISRTVCSYNYV
jgi:hypothetical protein